MLPKSLLSYGKLYIRNELCKRYNTIWKDQTQQCSKLRILNLVKPHLEFESYLSRVKNVKHCQVVTRFRISAHKFPIEVGRYTNIAYNLRLCPICKSKDVGDEYHYFSNCNNDKLVNLRENFINEISNINSSFKLLSKKDLFHYCMTMHDECITECTAKYVYSSTKIFNDSTVGN